MRTGTESAVTENIHETGEIQLAPAQQRQKVKYRWPHLDADAWRDEPLRRLAAIVGYRDPLIDLIARDANEGDTRMLVTDVLTEMLGYSKYEHLTTEYMVRGEFADYGIRVDGNIKVFVEVKRVSVALSDRHLRQVEMYSVNEGVEWMVVTNGRVWRLYRLIPGMPVRIDTVFEVDLLEDDVDLIADAMFHLSLEAMRRDTADELWRAVAATSEEQLAATVISPAVVAAIRAELAASTGYDCPEPALIAHLRNLVGAPQPPVG